MFCVCTLRYVYHASLPQFTTFSVSTSYIKFYGKVKIFEPIMINRHWWDRHFSLWFFIGGISTLQKRAKKTSNMQKWVIFGAGELKVSTLCILFLLLFWYDLMSFPLWHRLSLSAIDIFQEEAQDFSEKVAYFNLATYMVLMIRCHYIEHDRGLYDSTYECVSESSRELHAIGNADLVLQFDSSTKGMGSPWNLIVSVMHLLARVEKFIVKIHVYS